MILPLRFHSWVPSKMKVGLRKLDHGLRACRETAFAPLRPVSSQPSTRRGQDPFVGRPFSVIDVIRETPQASTIVLNNGGLDPLRFTPGQFITLVVEVDGERLRRPYSLCTDPARPGEFAFTVKRVPGGKVSNHLNEHTKIGDELHVFGPGGRFCADPKTGGHKHLVLVAGGSGITPMMSIIEAFLERSKTTRIDLVYANRSAEDTIFRGQLERLEAASPMLKVLRVLEAPPPGFDGITGRLTSENVSAVVPLSAEARYFVCGPAPMMDVVEAHLESAGVGPERVSTERFTPRPPRGTDLQAETHRVTFTRTGLTLEVGPQQTLLDAARSAGVKLNFSCAVGGCGACRVRVTSGKVRMETPHCLTEAEVAEGHCLTCVGRPVGPIEIEA